MHSGATLWRLDVSGPHPLINAAADRATTADPAIAASVSVFDHGATRRLELLFLARPDPAAVQAAIGLADAPVEVSLAPLQQEDWVERSLQGLPIVRAGRFVVRGSHHPRARGGVDLLIEAGEAFGTGHHATTATCLQLASDLFNRTRLAHVLDLGCGTGVLAIATAKATHARVAACDIDPVAVDVARANARLNGVGRRIRVIEADGLRDPRLRGARFDLIFANVLSGALIARAGDIAAALASGGRVILSGVLDPESRAVEAAFRGRGLARERRILQDGWATLVMRRGARLKTATTPSEAQARAAERGAGMTDDDVEILLEA